MLAFFLLTYIHQSINQLVINCFTPKLLRVSYIDMSKVGIIIFFFIRTSKPYVHASNEGGSVLSPVVHQKGNTCNISIYSGRQKYKINKCATHFKLIETLLLPLSSFSIFRSPIHSPMVA